MTSASWSRLAARSTGTAARAPSDAAVGEHDHDGAPREVEPARDHVVERRLEPLRPARHVEQQPEPLDARAHLERRELGHRQDALGQHVDGPARAACLPSLPLLRQSPERSPSATAVSNTQASRIGSIGGLVSCAKRSLKWSSSRRGRRSSIAAGGVSSPIEPTAGLPVPRERREQHLLVLARHAERDLQPAQVGDGRRRHLGGGLDHDALARRREALARDEAVHLVRQQHVARS